MATPKKTEPTPAVKQRKSARQAENERRAAANAERRRLGIPTPHEIKRAERKKRRHPKQVEYKKRRELEIERTRAADAAAKANSEKLATDLLAIHNKRGRSKGTAAKD